MLVDHGAPVDAVIVCKDNIPDKVVSRYEKEGSTPVVLRHRKHDYEIIREPLLAFENDLVRHDSLRIEKAIRHLLEDL